MKKIARFIVEKRWLFFMLFGALLIVCGLCIPHIKVEKDITMYLPDGTDTKRAIAIMEDEFVTNGITTVMVKDISFDDAQKLHDKIADIDGIRLFEFSSSKQYYNENCAKFTVMYDGPSDAAAVQEAYDKTIYILNESGYRYSVPVPLIDDYMDKFAGEMAVIIAIAAAVIVVVLLFTSKSFAEILAFPVVFIVAAVLNMGSNMWLGKISFVSNTVCIILQLALAIDYAIILCHRFTEEKDKNPNNRKEALINALAKAIPEIASSSLTTISGLVALMFMQLTLGLDLGLVLAKSIVCSLLTVFLLMPGILYYLSKPIDKTRHRNFVPKIRFWGKGVIKARFFMIPIFLAAVVGCAVLGQRTEYVYSTGAIDTDRPLPTVVAQRECDEVFGTDNMFAILLPIGDPQKEREVLELVVDMSVPENGTEPLVNSALGFSGIEYNGVYLVDDIDPGGFSELTGVNPAVSDIFFAMQAAATGQKYTLDYKAPLIDILDYIISIKDSANFKQFISDDMCAQLDEAKALIDYAKGQLVSEHYSRLVFNINGAVESPEAFALIDKLTPAVKELYPDAIFAGASMSAYDLNASFSHDNLLITLLTIAFIFVILAITFRSYIIPLVLVAVIQGAIFINFSLPVITGQNLFFFTYLIISAIQMGATIDYAILLTNRFRQLRVTNDKREALIQAVSGAFPTVFTSGTIMCIAGFLVGALVSDPLIASMGFYLGTGTIISIISVMTVLPALLYTLDGVLEKTVLKPRHPMKRLRMPNPSYPPYMQ